MRVKTKPTLRNNRNDYLKNLLIKYDKKGLKELQPSEILELILSFSMSGDSTPLINRLLDKFGSLSRILDAKQEFLMKTEGLSTNSLVLLKLIPDICRRVKTEQSAIHKYKDKQALRNMIVNQFIGRTTEHIVLALLDKDYNIKFCGALANGNINLVIISMQRILLKAIEFSASYVVVAHNHISGLVLPSNEDLIFTFDLNDTLENLGIKLLDHIVVAENASISISGYFDK